ncbi:hypothetical protein AVEN_168274-1 [Araneus ventricosus]|uniref:Uncharacterized protein n=1 Tax=Araneus ventricosus TaxID=182803 RepID=A0A4Y2FUK7_ARAVE|nr:hypothetical protein AVEN_168274-1 [Araneus ventricosus]
MRALSPAVGEPKPLLYPPGKRDPAYLAGGFSSTYSWCSPVEWIFPAPRNHIKSLLQKEPIIQWQKEWGNGETGRSVHIVLPKVKTTPTPWQRPEIMFVKGHGPFPTYLKRFNTETAIRVAAETWETPHTMLQAACLQPHTT